jgi:TPP-dependent indolepyruvate ferredoxin oxidoreductase alpha subunit
MRIKNIVPEACHICGKQTSLAAIEPHPTDPEMQLDTFRCEDCGWLEPFPSVRRNCPSGVVTDGQARLVDGRASQPGS